jgi:hypothetical protein
MSLLFCRRGLTISLALLIVGSPPLKRGSLKSHNRQGFLVSQELSSDPLSSPLKPLLGYALYFGDGV